LISLDTYPAIYKPATSERHNKTRGCSPAGDGIVTSME
jgi:hypothetical protein